MLHAYHLSVKRTKGTQQQDFMLPRAKKKSDESTSGCYCCYHPQKNLSERSLIQIFQVVLESAGRTFCEGFDCQFLYIREWFQKFNDGLDFLLESEKSEFSKRVSSENQ